MTAVMVFVVAIAVVLLIITVKKKRSEKFFGKFFFLWILIYRKRIHFPMKCTIIFKLFSQISKSREIILQHDIYRIIRPVFHQMPGMLESIMPMLTLIFLKYLNKCRKNKQCRRCNCKTGELYWKISFRALEQVSLFFSLVYISFYSRFLSTINV